MLSGTFVRTTWPLTFSVDSVRVNGEGLKPFTCLVTVEFVFVFGLLIKLGAIFLFSKIEKKKRNCE